MRENPFELEWQSTRGLQLSHLYSLSSFDNVIRVILSRTFVKRRHAVHVFKNADVFFSNILIVDINITTPFLSNLVHFSHFLIILFQELFFILLINILPNGSFPSFKWFNYRLLCHPLLCYKSYTFIPFLILFFLGLFFLTTNHTYVRTFFYVIFFYYCLLFIVYSFITLPFFISFFLFLVFFLYFFLSFVKTRWYALGRRNVQITSGIYRRLS